MSTKPLGYLVDVRARDLQFFFLISTPLAFAVMKKVLILYSENYCNMAPSFSTLWTLYYLYLLNNLTKDYQSPNNY